ncbi:unnamed protein product, partial [Amoebophrya sp. A120]|eukprot:GSA120T00008735001.1
MWTQFWGKIFGEPRPEPSQATKSTNSFRKCAERLEQEPRQQWCQGLDAVPSEAEICDALRGLKAGKSFAGVAPV